MQKLSNNVVDMIQWKKDHEFNMDNFECEYTINIDDDLYNIPFTLSLDEDTIEFNINYDILKGIYDEKDKED